jgi:Domain of unknown function (DUF3943)
MILSALPTIRIGQSNRVPLLKSAGGASDTILGALFAIAVFFAASGSSAQEFRSVPGSSIFTAETDSAESALPEQMSSLAPQAGTLETINAGREAALKYRPEPHKPVLSWETGSGKSYLIPALEIPVFILGVNAVARLTVNDKDENGNPAYDTNLSTFWDHLVHGTWVIDNDDFRTNQLRHPYQGAVYQNLARSAGLGYWESAAYTFVGSFLWETGGETTRPSINDQIASGIAGNFLGEPLFRMASLLLERKPGFWGELGAALISPPTAFNRLVFGDRFDPVFPSHDPAFFYRVRLGYTHTLFTEGGRESDFESNEASLDFVFAYGLPGKPGYSYRRPFDYFQVEFTAVSRTDKSPIENVMTRGLLVGKEYEVGETYRGVWGLFGSYDFISPAFFRVSSTALSLGTLGQWWLSRSIALQGIALAGLGYGAGGSVSGEGQRDFHYGLTEQGVLSGRLVLGDTAQFDATFRGYYITGTLATKPRGNETIARLSVGATVRIFGRHALGLQYLFSSRQGDYSDLPNQHQRMGTITFFYTLLSETEFGAVDWREAKSR